MKRGVKPKPLAQIEAAGTYQATRHGSRIDIASAGDPPIMPDYLPPEAVDVWQEELGRVMSMGIGEEDSSLFARYCCAEAMVRKAFAAGEPVPSSYLTALRQMGELLRIGGPSSRTGLKNGDSAKSSNPFAKLR